MRNSSTTDRTTRLGDNQKMEDRHQLKGPKYKNKKWLQRTYVEKGLAIRRIAKMCGVTPGTIKNWLDKFGIPRRREDNRLRLEGKRFGRWVALRDSGKRTKTRGILWECQCSCGKVSLVQGRNLVSGRSKSCGCYARDVNGSRWTIHGLSKTRIYKTWASVRSRCQNKNNTGYRWYGKKGIKVCREWDSSFPLFYFWAYANGYRDDLTIDRIDPSGNYEPKNCRWIPWRENVTRRFIEEPTPCQ